MTKFIKTGAVMAAYMYCPPESTR